MSASESQSVASGSEPDSEEVSGSGDESMEESGDSGSEEEQEILEPKVLPARGTRGNRMNTLIAEEDSADEEFWQQEFFAEEGKDQEYEKSSEGEDEADTDFSESVGLIPTLICWLSIFCCKLWRLLCSCMHSSSTYCTYHHRVTCRSQIATRKTHKSRKNLSGPQGQFVQCALANCTI